MGLFLDLIHLSEPATDGALEYIYKAHHDHGDDGIWQPHESPLIRRLVELFTQRGLDRLASVKQELLAWQQGIYHIPSTAPVQPPMGFVARWSHAELQLARLYLESLPPAQWSLADHMLSVDYVCQRYLAPEDLVLESDWLAQRATIMGKVQANLDKPVTVKQADAILMSPVMAVPGSLGAPVLSQTQASVLNFARSRAAEHVQALADNVRHRMRSVIAADLEQKAFGAAPPGTSSLETKLVDEFAALNRDWRRIAVTEAGEAQTQGYIASLKPGAKVKRVEQYRNACSFCRSIDGKIATVVAPDHQKKDPDTMVWPGKNNIGRSASPRKRVGDVLVAREPHEMWQLPAGLAHPHCRGRWVPTIDDEPGDDPAFGDVLRSILSS